MPEKKDYVSVSKGVHGLKLFKLQKYLQLARIIYCFQRKTPKCKYWVLKVLCLETQMVCSGWLKNESLCLHLWCSSKCCVAGRCNGLGLDIQRPDQEDCLQPWEQQMHHALVWILSWHYNYKTYFLIRKSTNMKMMRNLITVSGTLQIKQ